MRKYHNPWFNEECENARKELRAANRKYRYNKSSENIHCWSEMNTTKFRRKAVTHYRM